MHTYVYANIGRATWQLTLHINMSVPLRPLANIEEWTYSIRWTLVSQGFTQINLRAGTCNWPLPRHRPCLYDQKQEPKECVYLHLWMLETQCLCSNARLSPCTLDTSVARMGGRTLYTMNTALLNLQADKPAPCPVSCMQTVSQQSTVQPTCDQSATSSLVSKQISMADSRPARDPP